MDYISFVNQKQLEQTLSKVQARRNVATVYPAAENVLRALSMTPLSKVKVVIVGQDPYHQPGQADGLAFSSNSIPKSLANIFQELQTDLGVQKPLGGRLDHWANQGVLLLNRILTVEEGQPLSHKDMGWLEITKTIIQTISQEAKFVVFVLWGSFAQEVTPWIDSRHLIITAPHPSPLSAHRGFFGHRPFSQINRALESQGLETIKFSSCKH
jgi:uracil-DNA glycosylase